MDIELRTSYAALEQRAHDLQQLNDELQKEIAERRRIQKEIEESEVRYRGLFDNMSSAPPSMKLGTAEKTSCSVTSTAPVKRSRGSRRRVFWVVPLPRCSRG